MLSANEAHIVPTTLTARDWQRVRRGARGRARRRFVLVIVSAPVLLAVGEFEILTDWSGFAEDVTDWLRYVGYAFAAGLFVVVPVLVFFDVRRTLRGDPLALRVEIIYKRHSEPDERPSGLLFGRLFDTELLVDVASAVRIAASGDTIDDATLLGCRTIASTLAVERHVRVGAEQVLICAPDGRALATLSALR